MSRPLAPEYGPGAARSLRISSARKPRRTNLGMRRVGIGLIFILPWIVGFLGFTLYPMIKSLYYSLTSYDVLSPPTFVGFQNYIDLAHDHLFGNTLGNTLYMVAFGVPAGFVSAFLLAVLLNQRIRGRAIFRTAFFLPAITPTVAVAMVWLWIYDAQHGLINGFLASHGLRAIPWLTSTHLAKPSLIIIIAWAQGANMLIFLAALQGIPQELHEAARIDGANAFNRLIHVTIPMCTPAMLFVLITSLIDMFQQFTLPWVLTQGGPGTSTTVFGVYLYQNAFVYFHMGYASAMAWVLFLIIVGFSILLVKTSKRWVYYAE